MSIRAFLRTLRPALRLERTIRLVWQSGSCWVTANIALLVVQSTLPLLGLYIMKLVVDAMAAGLRGSDKGAVFEQVVMFMILAGIVTLASALCGAGTRLVLGTQAQAVADHMYDMLHTKSLEVDLEYYENSQYYDVLHRAQHEAPSRPLHIVHGLVQLSQNSFSLLAMGGLLLSFHWGLLVALLAAAIPGVLVRLRYADKVYAWQRTWTPVERQAWYYSWLLTRDSHAKEVRLFGLGPLLVQRFRDIRKRFRQERLTLTTKRAIADLMLRQAP